LIGKISYAQKDLKKRKKEMKFSEVMPNLEAAKEFIEMNKIKPSMVVIIWEEKND
jgi:hypothetical protein